jgi:hypothetical protein
MVGATPDSKKEKEIQLGGSNKDIRLFILIPLDSRRVFYTFFETTSYRSNSAFSMIWRYLNTKFYFFMRTHFPGLHVCH